MDNSTGNSITRDDFQKITGGGVHERQQSAAVHNISTLDGTKFSYYMHHMIIPVRVRVCVLNSVERWRWVFLLISVVQHKQCGTSTCGVMIMVMSLSNLSTAVHLLVYCKTASAMYTGTLVLVLRFWELQQSSTSYCTTVRDRIIYQ